MRFTPAKRTTLLLLLLLILLAIAFFVWSAINHRSLRLSLIHI